MIELLKRILRIIYNVSYSVNLHFLNKLQFFIHKLTIYRLQKLHNLHSGEKCVIIGMGPSLKISDLDRLKNYHTIACNKIFLAFTETEWRPSYYMVSDVLVAENNKKDINSLKIKKFFPEWIKHRCTGLRSINWIPVSNHNSYSSGKSVGFSKNLTNGIQPGGGTVVYDMLQFAYHLGFSEAVLIGIDFHFNYPSGLPSGEVCEQGEVLVSSGEVNHFTSNYRIAGEKWTIPKMDDQKVAFSKAFEVYCDSGRKLVNASRTSKLNVIPKVNFDEYFPET